MDTDETLKYEQISLEDIENIKDELIENNIPILRINKENDFVIFPHEQINILFENEVYSKVNLYLPKDYKNLITNSKDDNKIETYTFKTPEESEQEVNARLVEISKMSYDQKVVTIDSYNDQLIEIAKEPILNKKLAQNIIDVSSDTGLITKINMFESIQKIKNNKATSEEIKIQNKYLTNQTITLVTSISNILIKNKETQKMFSNLRTFSDGGTMDHSNRVFISYINFLAYYNNLLSRSSSFIHKVRTLFPTKYKKYYDRVLTMYSKDDYTKEFKSIGDVIDRGMRSLPLEHFHSYAVGALLHDIGKVKDLNYFEGATGRDTERIQKHLFNGYSLISQTAEYSLEVLLTVAFHHEYYGHGYGPFNTFYKNKVKSQPQFRFHSILTYDADASDKCDALAYFPSKVLEIIDVYDALIDPARKYRLGKVFSPLQALTIMKEDFIEKHTKIDPIIFDIFVSFMAESDSREDLSSAYLS